MTQPTPARRRCTDCDGFSTVHVTTGTRAADGTRQTLPVTCRACQGTGHAPVPATSRTAVHA